MMGFEWDDTKRLANLDRRGIDFIDVSERFDGDIVTVKDDRYSYGEQHLSAVVTRDYSDWSVTPLLTPLSPLRLRVERRKEAIHISYVDANSKYALLRLAYFPIIDEVQVGIMCASPEGEGYEVVFDNYQLIKLSAA